MQVKNWLLFCWLWQVKNWPYSKIPLGEIGCLSNFPGYLSMPLALYTSFSDLWRFPSPLSSTPATFNCLLLLILQARNFLIYPLSQHSHLGHLWLPTPNCATTVWLTGRRAMPVVTRCFKPNPYLGKKRISLGVTSILSICLWSHTSLDWNQLLMMLDWYLSMSKPKIFYLWWKL